MFIALRDVTINRVCTSAVNFCLRVYSMCNFSASRIYVLVSATVYSHNKRCEENSNFHLHSYRVASLCPRRIDGAQAELQALEKESLRVYQDTVSSCEVSNSMPGLFYSFSKYDGLLFTQHSLFWPLYNRSGMLLLTSQLETVS